MEKFRWGIIGTGYIAGNFAESMGCVANAEKVGVVGTSMQKSEAFASKFGFAKNYESAEEMFRSTALDAVYIAVPNNLHYEYVMAALDAGINVLCEKPMPDNVKQLTEMIAKAKQKDLFLMEGLWTRCFPAIRKAKQWLDEGAIGKVIAVHAGFGLKALEEGWQPWKRNVQSSAGAIRDVGIYPLSIAFLAFGRPPEKCVSSYILEGGTDMHEEMMLQYDGGGSAFLSSSFFMTTEHHAMIYGERGAIRLGEKFWSPNHAELFKYSDTDVFTLELAEDFDGSYESKGMQFEIMHVQDCIASGKKESPYFPLSESMEICKVIDGFRKEWGVVYTTD